LPAALNYVGVWPSSTWELLYAFIFRYCSFYN